MANLTDEELKQRDALIRERYKFITSKQTYLTELAKSTFEHFIKVVLTLVAAGVAFFAVVSESKSLGVDTSLVAPLLWVVQLLVGALAAGRAGGRTEVASGVCSQSGIGPRGSEGYAALSNGIVVSFNPRHHAQALNEDQAPLVEARSRCAGNCVAGNAP